MPSTVFETITTNRSISSYNNISITVTDLNHTSFSKYLALLQSKIMTTTTAMKTAATAKILNASIQKQQQPNIEERNNNVASSASSSSDSLTTATAMQFVKKHNARDEGGSCTSTAFNDVYRSTFQGVGIGGGCVGSGYLPASTTTALEQYRLHLYNYALNIERLRCPQYSAAAAMAAAAAYASSGGGGNGSNSAVIAAATAAASSPYVTSGNSHHRFALSMSLFPPQRIFQPEEPKPQHSYIGLIAMAILSSVETKLVLSDIYQYILDNYPYFRTRGPGWRNSIRHNLSLNDCFIKSGRSANGKGHYWAIHPANMDDFLKGDFRRRKAQRKVRKHMGLSVDDTSTDSPSPPSSLPPPPPPLSQLIAHPSLAAAAAHMHTHTFGGYLQQHLYPHHTHAVFHPQHHHHAVLPFEQHQQQHHYIGQAFNNSSAAAAAAASAYAAQAASIVPTKNIISQTHPMLHQQRHIQHAQQHAASAYNNSDVNDNNSSSNNNNQLEIINETRTTTTKTTASVIANLYSQTRKRQFDVASLLAPDVKVVDITADDNEMTTIEGGAAAVGGGITTTQHTVITKVSVQHQKQQHHHHLSYQHPQHPLQPLQHILHTEFDDQQDIDVVANDTEENYKLQRLSDNIDLNHYDKAYVDAGSQPEQETDVDVNHTDNNSVLSSSRRSSLDAAIDGVSTSQRQSPVSETTTTTTTTTEMLTHSLRPQQPQQTDENPLIVATEIQSIVTPTTSYEVMCSSSSLCEQLNQQQDQESLERTTLTALHSHNSSPSHSSNSNNTSSNNTSSPNHRNEINEQQQQQRVILHEREQQTNTVQRLMHQLQPQQQQLHHQHSANSELSNVDPHIFGRYYGTYMAAAARRIGGINLAALQSASSSSSQHQQQKH